MRLLFVSNLYEPYARGGAEVVAKRSLQAAAALGHDVSLLTARPKRVGATRQLRTEQQDGITVHSFYPRNLFFYGDDHRFPIWARAPWHLLDQYNIHTAGIMKETLTRSQPDVVITHNLMGLGFTVPAVIRAFGKKHVHVLHDIQLAVRSGIMLHGQEHRWDTDGLFARLYQRSVRRQFGSPDVVVSPSQFLLGFYEQLRYFPNSKRVLLRNPVDEHFYGVSHEPRAGAFRLLFVGQLAEHKGVRILMEAFDQARQTSNITLDIVGDGAMQASVKAWADGNKAVRCLGRLPNESLVQQYGQADLLIMPTLTYENSPSVVFEALAAGVPVCVSDIGGAAEAVEHGVNGFSVRPGDVRALAACISRASQEPRWEAWREAAAKSVQGLDAQGYMQRLLAQ